MLASVAVAVAAVTFVFRQYQPWLWYIVAFVAIRVACAGAGFYSTALYAVGAQRGLYAPAVVAGIVAIMANAFLTRPMGLAGAVIAYLITQVVVAGLTIFAFRRAARPHPIAATSAVTAN